MGLRVRIRFPPARSQPRTGPTASRGARHLPTAETATTRRSKFPLRIASNQEHGGGPKKSLHLIAALHNSQGDLRDRWGIGLRAQMQSPRLRRTVVFVRTARKELRDVGLLRTGTSPLG